MICPSKQILSIKTHTGKGLKGHLWHCLCFLPRDLFPTRRGPDLDEEKGEGEPAAAEAEDGLGFPEFFPVNRNLRRKWIWQSDNILGHKFWAKQF